MLGLLVLIFLFTLFILALGRIGWLPNKHSCDMTSPLNHVIYHAPPARYNDQIVNKWVDKPWRTDGKRIPCRIEVYDDTIPVQERKLIIYSHGNAEDMLNCIELLRQVSRSVKSDVLCWDYSGYGLNDANVDERTPEGVNMSLRAIYNSLIRDNEENYHPRNILFWGYSLGSGPTTAVVAALCREGTPPLGLILFGAYTSILDVVSHWSHASLANLFTPRWDNVREIKYVTCPILIIHGQSDNMIPLVHARKLKAANSNAKLIILPNIGHTTFSYSDSIKEVNQWLQEISE